jgi:hypothetical protein
MKRLFFALLAVGLGFASQTVAQNNPVVVELFTSQGCSSCPPADAMLHELAARDDVIALALHVDYWDYIGWKDPFGNPAHAERQRAYAAAGNRRSVYTPEILVNGSTDIVGAKPMKLAKAISEHAAKPSAVVLDLRRQGGALQITGRSAAPLDGPLTVHMLRYIPDKETQIKRGENAGKTFVYANIVENWAVLGDWDGQSPLSMTAPIEGDQPVVVILQQQNAGPIMAAARLR